jgi:hypothetical protein
VAQHRAAEHHHGRPSGSDHGPRRHTQCNCVGHSCCAARTFLPSASVLPVAAAGDVPAAVPPGLARWMVPSRPSYVQPPAIGPPALS